MNPKRKRETFFEKDLPFAFITLLFITYVISQLLVAISKLGYISESETSSIFLGSSILGFVLFLLYCYIKHKRIRGH